MFTETVGLGLKSMMVIVVKTSNSNILGETETGQVDQNGPCGRPGPARDVAAGWTSHL